jgi:hypothetical protein
VFAGLNVCLTCLDLLYLGSMHLLVDIEFMDNLDDSFSRRGPVGRSAEQERFPILGQL